MKILRFIGNSGRRGHGFAYFLGLGALFFTQDLAAQSPPPAPPSAQAQAPAPNREAAVERYKRGRKLMEQQLWGPALAEFLESSRLYPDAWTPIGGAAKCLTMLGRFDEALDLYALLVKNFSERMKPAERDLALQEVEQARRMVGTIEIEGSEPGATIVVDQQPRGHYPLLSPLRVPAGSHLVRVYKEGFEPLEIRADVPGGTSKLLRAKLIKLLKTGTLQLAETDGKEVGVIVDGFPAGQTPLNLQLAPGKHTVLLQGEGNLGTPPSTIEIKADELLPLRLKAEVLSATLRVVPEPFDALVSVDSVVVGRGTWEGRVKPGTHKIEVAADGFLAETRKIIVGDHRRDAVRMELPRNPKSPFWREPPPPPHYTAEFSTGLMLAPSVGGDISSACTQNCQLSMGLGTYSAFRGGYELSSGFSFGMALGYATVQQEAQDRTAHLNVVSLPNNATASGTADDVLSIRGVFGGIWAGYSFRPFDSNFPFHLRATAGLLWGSASDSRNGQFQANLDGRSFRVGTLVEQKTAGFIVAAPEVRLGYRLLRKLEVYAGLEVPLWFALSQPRWIDDPKNGHAVYAGSDGYGWFNAESYTSRVIVGFVPGFGVKIDL